MHRWIAALLFAGCAAQSDAPVEAPPRSEAMAEVQTPEDSVDPAEPTEQATDAETSTPPAAREPPDDRFSPQDADAPHWYVPLAQVALDPPNEVEKEMQRDCAQTYRLQAADVTDDELFGALMCMGEDHGVAQTIRIARVLVERFPESEHVPAALIAAGRGYERIDRLDAAMKHYERMLQVYPKHDLARVVGQRAVCLARRLSLADAEQELLHQLAKFYGRRGFTVPGPDALPALCSES